MPASKAALPKFKKKSEAPLWHKDMLLEEKRVQRGEHEPEVQRAQSFLTYRPNLDRKGWSMKSLICLDETSEVPLLEQLKRGDTLVCLPPKTLSLTSAFFSGVSLPLWKKPVFLSPRYGPLMLAEVAPLRGGSESARVAGRAPRGEAVGGRMPNGL